MKLFGKWLYIPAWVLIGTGYLLSLFLLAKGYLILVVCAILLGIATAELKG